MSKPTLSDIRDELMDALVVTLRTAGLTTEPQPALPPPNDVEAEKSVVGAVLCQEISIVELDDLHPDHFFLGLHRWIFEKATAAQMAGVELTVGLLVAAAIDEGIAGESIREDINDLLAEPFRCPDEVRELARKIVQKAHARTLIEKLQAVELALRTSVRTPEQATRYLQSLGVV